MAEREDWGPNQNHDQNQHQFRQKRGRLNSRPNHNSRIYNNLGVRDLRELLDRKRSEQGGNQPGYQTDGKIPPPDPSYNYLKDPLRETTESSRYHRPHQSYNRGNNTRRDNNNHAFKEHAHNSHRTLNRDIENPLNIKVEFSTSTGEHSYRLDKETVLPTIKHVPDQIQKNYGNTRARGNFRARGRGRGRARGRGFNQNRPTRNETFKSNNNAWESGANQDEAASNFVSFGLDDEETWQVNDDKHFREDSENRELQEVSLEDYAEDEGEVSLEQNAGIVDLEKEIENLKIADDKNSAVVKEVQEILVDETTK